MLVVVANDLPSTVRRAWADGLRVKPRILGRVGQPPPDWYRRSIFCLMYKSTHLMEW